MSFVPYRHTPSRFLVFYKKYLNGFLFFKETKYSHPLHSYYHIDRKLNQLELKSARYFYSRIMYSKTSGTIPYRNYSTLRTNFQECEDLYEVEIHTDLKKELVNYLNDSEIQNAWEKYLELRKDKKFLLQRHELDQFLGILWFCPEKNNKRKMLTLLEDNQKGSWNTVTLFQYSIWISCLYECNRYEGLTEKYQFLKETFGHPLPPSIYDTILSYYLDTDSKLALQFFSALTLEGVSYENLGLEFLNKLLKFHAARGSKDSCNKLLTEVFKQFGVIPDSLLRTIILTSYNFKRSSQAEFFFDLVRELNYDTGPHFYNQVLLCLTKTNLSPEELFEWVSKNMTTKNNFNTSTVNKLRDLIEETYPDTALSQFVQLFKRLEVPPNIPSCFIYFKLALQQADPSSIKRLSQFLLSDKVNSFEEALYCLLKGTKHLQSFQLFRSMVLTWPPLCSVFLNIFLSSYIPKKLDEEAIRNILLIYNSKKISLTSYTYGILMNIYSRCNNLGKVENLLNYLLKESIQLDITFITSLMISYLRSEEHEKLRTTYKEAVRSGITPDTYALSILAESFGKTRDWEDLERLFLESVNYYRRNPINCPADHKFWIKVISIYAQTGKYKDASRVFDTLLELNIELDVSFYSELLIAYGFHLDFENSYRVYREAIDRNITIDSNFGLLLLKTTIQSKGYIFTLNLLQELQSSVLISSTQVCQLFLQHDSGYMTCEIFIYLYGIYNKELHRLLDEKHILELFLRKGVELNCIEPLRELLCLSELILESDIPEPLWEAILKAALHLEYWDWALDLLKFCSQFKPKPKRRNLPLALLNLTLKSLSKAGKWAMVDYSLLNFHHPDVFTLHTIIKSCLHRNELRYADSYLELFRMKFGIIPDPVVCAEFVKYYTSSSTLNLEKALIWFNNHGEGQRPVDASYAYLIRGYTLLDDTRMVKLVKTAWRSRLKTIKTNET